MVDHAQDHFGTLDASDSATAARWFHQGEPGALRAFYDVVVQELEQGEVPPAETVLELLKGMGAPRQTDMHRQKIDVLWELVCLQMIDSPGSGREPSLRSACFAWHARLENRPVSSLTAFERQV